MKTLETAPRGRFLLRFCLDDAKVTTASGAAHARAITPPTCDFATAEARADAMLFDIGLDDENSFEAIALLAYQLDDELQERRTWERLYRARSR